MEVLRYLDFDVPSGKITPQQSVILNKAKEELPSASDMDKADDIEMLEIVKSMENLISRVSQTDDDLFKHPLHELLGLDKQLRSIRGMLKVEVAKRFSGKNTSRKRSEHLREFESIQESTTVSFEKTSPIKSPS